MANVAPPYSTYVNTAENKRVITDYIALLDPSDAPFIEAIAVLTALQVNSASLIKEHWLSGLRIRLRRLQAFLR